MKAPEKFVIFHFVARFDRGKGRIAHGVPFLPVTGALRLEASGYRNKRKYLDVELKLRTYTQSGFPENQQSGVWKLALRATRQEGRLLSRLSRLPLTDDSTPK